MSKTLANKLFNVNVILTFENCEEFHDGSQEFFDLKLTVSPDDKNVVTFLNENFFDRVVDMCDETERSPHDLIKISTCADWAIYEEVTGQKALYRHGHGCKWCFGEGRLDIDIWEKCLIDTFGFGANVDMSWVNKPFEKQVEIE